MFFLFFILLILLGLVSHKHIHLFGGKFEYLTVLRALGLHFYYLLF